MSNRPCILVLLLLLAGCASAESLLEKNQTLTTLSSQREAVLDQLLKASHAPGGAATAGQPDLMTLEIRRAELEDSLAQLSQEAAVAGRDADDPANAVAFFRIATVAAWQARLATVDDLAAEGLALCAANGQGDRLAFKPRDCSLMLIAPPLAANDELVLRWQDGGDSVVAEEPAFWQGLFTGFADNAEVLLADTAEVQQAAVPAEFKAGLRQRTFQLYCNAAGAFVELRLRTATPEAAEALVAGRNQQVAAQILAIGGGARCPDAL